MDKNITIQEQLKSNLALILTIITFIFSYAKQTNEITVLQSQVNELKAQQVSADKNIQTIANDIVYIRTTLDYLKQRI